MLVKVTAEKTVRMTFEGVVDVEDGDTTEDALHEIDDIEWDCWSSEIDVLHEVEAE